jgi:hypothetical protein
MTHKEATALAAESHCLVCHATPCEPCHTTHRGMGGAKAGWEAHEWVPLCRKHHNELDARNGVSARCTEQTRITRYIVNVKARDWQRAHQ